ncbi:hypothetical protein DSECCO2_539690 [anaerobic digester metagenome]
MAIVLGGGADQRRPADIYILNDLGVSGIFLHAHISKGIQVYHHDIDAIDPMFHQTADMGVVCPVCQNAAMNLGMQGLHSSAQYLGEPGVVAHLHQGAAKLFQMPRGV